MGRVMEIDALVTAMKIFLAVGKTDHFSLTVSSSFFVSDSLTFLGNATSHALHRNAQHLFSMKKSSIPRYPKLTHEQA